MKIFIKIAVLWCVAGSCFAQALSPEETIFNLMREYIQYPSKSIESQISQEISELTDESNTGMLYYSDFIDVLESRIQSNKRTSINLAIDLIKIADGAFSFDLYAILSDLITRNSTLFLETIKSLNDVELARSLILNTAELDVEYNNCSFWGTRIKAITGVDSPTLSSAQTLTLEVLKLRMSECAQQGAQADPLPRRMFCA